MTDMGYLPDVGEDHILLFITNEQRNTMIMEAEWPSTAEPTPDHKFYKMPKLDPRCEEMTALYGGRSAYLHFLDRFYSKEKMDLEACKREFIEPESRVYIFISDPKCAREYSCRYDDIRSQWYIPADHPLRNDLQNKFSSTNAETQWRKATDQIYKRIEKKEAAFSNPIFAECNDDGEFIRTRGRKSGPPTNARLIKRMFEIRVAKGMITAQTSKRKAAELIAKELGMMGPTYFLERPAKPNEIIPVGADIGPDMVLKNLDPNNDQYHTMISIAMSYKNL